MQNSDLRVSGYILVGTSTMADAREVAHSEKSQ